MRSCATLRRMSYGRLARIKFPTSWRKARNSAVSKRFLTSKGLSRQQNSMRDACLNEFSRFG